MQRAGLVLFGALFALLFVGVAVGVGIGSATPVPPGAVAIVEGAPSGLDVITKAEFDHEMRVQSLEKGLDGVPQPNSPEYRSLKREAMSKLVEVDWVEAQAQQMGLAATPREIVEKLSPGEGEAMRGLGLTQKDVDARMRWYLAGDNIQELLRERVRKPSNAEVRAYYEESPPAGKSLAEARAEISAEIENRRTSELFGRVETKYRREWRNQTRCADGFVVEQCSNFPPFGRSSVASAACYEADPKEPVEECQAPVIATRPAVPGSVRWWDLEGERLVQRPIPPGGAEALPGE